MAQKTPVDIVRQASTLSILWGVLLIVFGMVVTLVINGETIKAEGDYGITKDGRIFGILNKVTKSGGDGPNEGDLFSFKVKVSDNKLTIDDLRGTKDSSEAQQLVQGDYEKQK